MAAPGTGMGRQTVDLAELAARDGRYRVEAFHLVFEALERTIRLLGEGQLDHLPPYAGVRQVDPKRRSTHVSGRELLEGFRIRAREEYGALALPVLERFGLRRTEDVGEIVFLLVETGIWGSQECDTKADFAGGYDFAEAFGPDATLEN